MQATGLNLRSRCVCDKVVWFLGVCFSSGGRKTQRALCLGMWVWASLSSNPQFTDAASKVTQTHTHRYTRKHLHLCFCHSSHWRQSMLSIPLGTMLNTSPFIFERHYQHSNCRPPPQHAHELTQIRAHGTQWLLFIVHSFMWRASCLAWYSIIFQPTLSLQFPEGPVDHKPTTLILQHTGSFKPKVLLFGAHYSLLASPADT